MSCHKAIVVITGRHIVFMVTYIYIYIYICLYTVRKRHTTYMPHLTKDKVQFEMYWRLVCGTFSWLTMDILE